MKIAKNTLKVVLLLILIYLVYCIASAIPAICYTRNNTQQYYNDQIEHIEAMENKYKTNYQPVDEKEFCDFDNNNIELMQNTKLNQLRVLATHNSYKKELNSASHFFFNYGAPFLGAKHGNTAYNYSYESLTSQLDNGIRSFEMDAVKNSNNKIECVHHSLFDNHSSAIDFNLGLKELAMWSNNNPNHMPITIIIEPKNKSVLANTKAIKVSDIKSIEKMAQKHFGNTLYTPQIMLNNNKDFIELAENNAYPNLQEMKGKVMILLHTSKVMEEYIESDKTMQSQNFFPLIEDKKIQANDNLRKYSCFAISNDPLKTDMLNKLTNKNNMIVRTRINIYPNHQEENFKKSIESNAQILSGDFPPRTDKKGNYVSYLKDKYTMILNTKK